jgi:hypothetical protein
MGQKRIEEIHQEIAKLKIELAEQESNLYVSCKYTLLNGGGCGRKIKIKNLVIFRSEYYVSPYGCTGGAYWTISNNVEFLCPKCGDVNYIKHKTHDIYGLLVRRCKKEITYQDKKQGIVVRRKHFKDMLSKLETPT